MIRYFCDWAPCDKEAEWQVDVLTSGEHGITHRDIKHACSDHVGTVCDPQAWRNEVKSFKKEKAA